MSTRYITSVLQVLGCELYNEIVSVYTYCVLTSMTYFICPLSSLSVSLWKLNLMNEIYLLLTSLLNLVLFNFNVFTVISRQSSSCIIKVLFIFYLYRIIYIFCLNGGILFVYVLILKNYLLSCFHVFCYVHICKDQTFLYQKSTVNWNKWNPRLQ